MAAVAYTEDGRSVSLAIQIGSGGEGVIYASPSEPLECAKIYTKPILPETHKKLSLMVSNPPPDPTYKVRMHRSICWPTAILYKDPSRNALAGFVMPKLDLKIFQKAFLYINADDRKARFGGGFTWKHLVIAATNVTSAVAAIHEQGYCIGDLNESNILIAPNALITLIDCDSFQVPDSAAGKTYRSPAGKGEYLAPELQGKHLPDVDRTIATDSFALAILLFQLLMQGTHPYQAKGRLVDKAASTEEKILLGHFPYSMHSREIAPPDYAPHFEILHPEIRKLFERCFTRGHGSPDQRPTAREWYSALRSLDSTFRQCQVNANHLYFDHLRSCPWCEMESSNGRDPFPSPVGQQVALEDSANLLDSLEKRLEYLYPYVVMAFADGILTSEEESQLNAFGKKLQIPPKEIEKLIQTEAAKVQGKRGKAPGSPELALSQRSFEFSNIRQGTSLSGRFVITNTGGGILSGTIKANRPWLVLPQSVIDPAHHIQQHAFYLDTSKLTLGTKHHATIEIASNAGSTRIDVSVAVEMEREALSRWRKQVFWAGALLGAILGLAIFKAIPSPYAISVTQVAGLVGAIALVVVCAVAGKWGGGIGGFFLASMLQAIFMRATMLGYSSAAWAEITSAFLFFWAKPLLTARLAGNARGKVWAAVSAVVVAVILIGAGVVFERSIPQPLNLGSAKLPVEDKLAGSTIGAAAGIQWTNAIGNRGAVFSAANSSRIEYPGLIPSEGTLEFWIKVNSGYRYENFQFKPDQDDAMIFSSDVQGGDVTWPGTTKVFVSRNGNLSIWMATVKGPNHNPATEAHETAFRFGEWHAIGVSYGSQGQFIMLDGRMVASSPRRTQTLGSAGSQQSPLDIPTIGETVSHFWQNHRYEGGFEGILAAFRVSGKQGDWLLAKGITEQISGSQEISPSQGVPNDSGQPNAENTPLNTTPSGVETSNAGEPRVESVSAVMSKQTQTITLTGSGFGTHEPYTGDSDYIRISDLTKRWNAGWSKDPGSDKVTLIVASWTDTSIVISGFAGAYGAWGNSVSAGDTISFQLWNAQTGLGPATYGIVASASAEAASSTESAITEMVSHWAAGHAANDNEAIASFYAAMVDPYFDLHNVTPAFILQNQGNLLNKGIRLSQYQVVNVIVTMNSDNDATVNFEKLWSTRPGGSIPNHTRSQLQVRNFDGKWLITGERDF
jgi:serine/threonine protein kinase